MIEGGSGRGRAFGQGNDYGQALGQAKMTELATVPGCSPTKVGVDLSLYGRNELGSSEAEEK